MRHRLLLVSLLLLTACPASRRAREAYIRTVDGYTQDATLYKYAGTALHLQATYLSASLAEQIAGERERLLGPTADDQAAFIARMTADRAAYHELVLVASASADGLEPRFGDDDDAWRLRLVADGQSQELVTVFKIRDPSVMHRALYPNLSEWNELWVARFERTVAQPDQVELQLGSGMGHKTLTFTADQLR